MNVTLFAGEDQIVGRNHTAAGDQLLRPALRLAQIGRQPVAVTERRDLDEIERQFTQPPLRTPPGHHISHPCSILRVTADVRLALIPKESADGIAGQRVHHGVVHRHRTHVVGQFGNGFLRKVNVRIGLQRLARGPALDAAAAPRTVDDPDRDIQRPREHFGEEIGRGAAPRGGSRREFVPGARNTLLRRIALRIGHLQEADAAALRIGAGDGLVATLDQTVPIAAERHVHIALTAAKPHLADQHVVQHPLVATRNGDPLRLVTTGGSFQRHLPAAFPVAFRRGFRAPRGHDFHRRMRIGPAPKFHIRILLQHHVAADGIGKGDLRRNAPRRRKAEEEQKHFFHSRFSFGFLQI